MAEALVGGAFLAASLQVLFDRLASRQVVDFFRGRKVSRVMLRKLKATVNSVEGVLDDAEEKQITKPSVKRWLDDLKDAFYEAEDLLDEIAYEDLRLEMEAGSHISSDKYKDEMDAKLEEILETLEHLVDQKDKLGLRVGVGEKPLPSSQRRIPTTSLIDKSSIYGRDGDREAIMELLLSESNGLDVIPIVGMGGIGKTTLAQLVYSDNRLQGLFDLKAWVCISVEFDVFKVTKDILKELGSVNWDKMTANQLHLELEKMVKGKRFLLVLDDVWNEKYEHWDCLRQPLKSGAQGSKILVTTRNGNVASIMRTVPTHQLKELKDHDCWFLFVKHAFGDEDPSLHPELEVIGRTIVRKCKGLPLAAKVLGGLLGSKRDAKEWKKILESNMWNLSNEHILPALRLSYYCLPSHLKRCFAYCAIFPQNYKFKKEELILLWMAEGLIVQPPEIEEMVVGDEYFDDLVSRSFFQRSSDRQSRFVMHDLLNDLAKFVAGEFFFRMEGNDVVNFGRTRHISCLIGDNMGNKVNAICKAKSLRTFIHEKYNRDSFYRQIKNKRDRLNVTSLTNNMVYDLLQTLHCLRALSLSRYGNFFQVTDLVGNLKHLRYLNFEGMYMKELPESITSLYYLQTLILTNCLFLVKLPTGMARLINLSHLDIIGTKLQEMPLQIGKLRKLQCLTDFFLAKKSGSSIKELRELVHLSGRLWIWNVRCVGDARDALEANLKSKKNLKDLELRWGSDAENSQHDREVLEQLQPHANLEHLSIYDYGGTRFPRWVGDSSFSNIISLKLFRCKYCSFLPPAGQLASLKKLYIEGCDEVVVIGPEFYGRGTTTMKPFQSLESLSFQNLPEWCEWIICGDEDDSGAFPLLQELVIRRCPKLTKMLPSFLPSLTTLDIDDCERLAFLLPRPPILGRIKFYCFSACVEQEKRVELVKLQSGLKRLNVMQCDFDSLLETMEQNGYSSMLEEIKIKFCGSLECFPMQFPNLSTLSLYSCPLLKSICASDRPLGDLTCLTYMEIWNCPNLISFPDEGLHAPNLKCLLLKDCANLKSMPDRMHFLFHSLVSLEIDGCPEVESFPHGGLPSKLEFLEIGSCDKLIAGRMEWNLQMLCSFSHFRIALNDDVESFPEESLLPATLMSLKVLGLRNLKSLDCKVLCQFTSLKKLQIENCPELQIKSMATEGLHHLTSLEELCVKSCLKFHSMPKEGLPPCLTALFISHLLNLESLDCKGLQQLTSLEKLYIQCCPMIESMPKDGLPSSLISLEIGFLPNLKSLKGLQRLTSLKKLYVHHCPKLKRIPHGRLPSSLLASTSISAAKSSQDWLE